MGICVRCNAGQNTPLGTHVISFKVETEKAIDICGPYCFTCMAIANPASPFQMVVMEDEEKAPEEESAGPSRKLRKRSRKQELDMAEELGGVAQRGSGSMSGAKGDVRLHGKYRIEAKLTQNKSYPLKLETLNKIESECSDFERPALVVEFIERSTHRRRACWAVIPYDDLAETIRDASTDHR